MMFAGAALVLALHGQARATTSPPATFFEDVDVYDETGIHENYVCAGSAPGLDPCGGTGTGNLAIGSGADFQGTGFASADVQNPAFGPLTLSVSASGKDRVESFADGESDFTLELVGPAGSQTVAVRADVIAHADVTLADPSDFLASATAGAGIDLYNSIGQTILASFSVFSPTPDIPTTVDAAAGDHFCFEKTCVGSADMNASLLFLLSPNVVYGVSVFATAGVLNDFGDSPSEKTAEASVDPHFYLDPTYGDPAYSLVLSPGTNNNPPGTTVVPEPSAWTMLILGFGALGWTARRRRTSPA
jgi:hypothetical protein